ncbi:uncharacterized protein EDB91DRAFT_1129847 [Suillus paluster]|uniref:uncharacterized protein n=1 Tax=Suillus paluster TaxID=48578 RepID=UPI001B882A01|nr:uncharacterized protein EDB91DRAFT_1129847 [Suillus paluster]KAG1741870.1 hypothetical protein EDB91DRAFT_1129847 [Suillus paluster]
MGHKVSQPSAADLSEMEPSGSSNYQPSVADVFRVKRYLQSKLPTELIDRIIDDASYWPHSSVYLVRPSTVPIYRDGKRGEDGIYIRSLPLGIHGTDRDFTLVEEDFEDGGAAWMKNLRMGGSDESSPSALSHPCRKIEFHLWSHDQRLREQFPETFNASYIWFYVSIEKLQTPISADNVVEWPPQLLFEECDASRIQSDTAKPFLPPSIAIRKNVAAKSQGSEHIIHWHFRGENDQEPGDDSVWHFLDNSFDRPAAKAAEVVRLLHSIQIGDCVSLWAHGRFPNSEDKVQQAKVTVYWAV